MLAAPQMASTRVGSTVRMPCSTSGVARAPLTRTRTVVRAAEDADAELEKRLEKLRQAKGATPYGQGTKAEKNEKKGAAAPKPVEPAPKPVYDFTGETVYYEGGPHKGDLATNIALGTTLVWLPLTIGAVGRAAFVKYRFTDKRFSVTTTAPWKNEQTDVAYQEVQDVVTVGRGIGLWGDMVVTLNNGDKVELRSLERFKELKDYILARRDALAPKSAAAAAGKGRPAGGMVTAEELMGEAPKPKAKGFSS